MGARAPVPPHPLLPVSYAYGNERGRSRRDRRGGEEKVGRLSQPLNSQSPPHQSYFDQWSQMTANLGVEYSEVAEADIRCITDDL